MITLSCESNLDHQDWDETAAMGCDSCGTATRAILAVQATVKTLERPRHGRVGGGHLLGRNHCGVPNILLAPA